MMPTLPTAAILLALISAGPTLAQWTTVNNGLTNLTQGAATLGSSPTHLFARGGGNIFRSANNGDSWSEVANPEFLNPSDCGYFFADRYFAGLNSAQACIHYTEDEGDTWTAATGAPTATVVRGFFEYGGGLFAYTSNAGIYFTLDGETWSATNNGLTNLNVIGMSAAGPYFVAATVGGGIFRTINGASWSPVTGIANGDLNGEHIWQMGNAHYYTAQGGVAYRSTDLGASWSAWTPPAQFGLGVVEVKRFDTRVYMEARHSAGGQRDSIYVTTNGTTWTNITGNLNAADLNGSGLLEHGGHLYIAYNFLSQGVGIKRYELATSVYDRSTTITPSVFPNPAEDLVTLTLPNEHGPVDYALFDAAGRNVLTGRSVTGSTQVDIGALAPGCYLLRMDDGGVAPVRVLKR